ncbi:hypothetical protein GGX14DRAFT_633305 [Mycena pura]|uniref:Uncharacterized protein n=1 Tax=Mycena pura TaxID=153505 RepID=A0AAD6VBZ1_9AGAR|nr:hypothetical protein GGX14DRAFT_633305 [Mycena pura]
MSEPAANFKSKILFFDIVHSPKAGDQKPAHLVIAQDGRRLWARGRVVLEISSESPQIVLPTRNSNSTTTNVIITRQHPLSENKETMSWHRASQISVHAQSMESEMALDASQLRTNYANSAGYGEKHIWTTSLGAYLGEGMDYRGLSRVCIDTGSQRLMVFNTPQPYTWDPTADKFLEERKCPVHRAIDTTNMASTPLSATDTPLSTTDSSGTPVVKKQASYAGGAYLYGNEYEGDLCILGASNERTGIAPLHKVEKVKFGGIIGATADMVGSAMDGVLGLQPTFDNQGTDFIHKLAEAYGLKDNMVFSNFRERVAMVNFVSVIGIFVSGRKRAQAGSAITEMSKGVGRAAPRSGPRGERQLPAGRGLGQSPNPGPGWKTPAAAAKKVKEKGEG